MALKSTSTYSFAQVSAVLKYGKGTVIKLSEGGVGEEGIQIESALDTNIMKYGSDGSVQHSLRIARPGTMKVQVMRNNTLNSELANAYNNTTATAAAHGLMVLTISDSASGESTTCTGVAFKKLPANLYKMDAEPITWEFDVGNIFYEPGKINDDDAQDGGAAQP